MYNRGRSFNFVWSNKLLVEIIISDRSVPTNKDCCNPGGYLTFGGKMVKEYLKYKKYPHFDKRMSVNKARKLLKNENVIKEHGFFPFIHYTIESKKLEKVDNKIYAKKEPKKREIYYCSHFDRYIYQHYAHFIGLKYNDYMVKNEIDECSGAYRIERGKCNIDFAYDMLELIKKKEDVIVIVGDFTAFFDNLNHINLKRRLEKVLNEKLDDKLYKVFKSLTKFKYVNMTDLYDYYTVRNKKRSEKYYMRKLNVLMSINEFRDFIKSKNSTTNEDYLKNNNNDYGIVQGSPMSGLLANIYMIDFDKSMKKLANNYNGKYLRYSDDFMLVIECSNLSKVNKIYEKIQELIKSAGKIELKKEKTNIYQYKNGCLKCVNQLVFNSENTTNIINFLGFSFDGKNISIKDKTISKFFYKMNKKIKGLINKKNSLTIKQIYDKFSFQGESKKNTKSNKGNFITYVKRAEKKFSGETKIANVRKSSKIKVTERIGIIKSKYNGK